ncbi:MAG: hypothetical protein K2K60_06525 [Clostridia bacterium]|nr:hypothetical protein [Clostridia bacterium]
MLNTFIDYIFSTVGELEENIMIMDEYKKLLNESYTLYENLRKELSLEQRAEIEKFLDLTESKESTSNKAYFKEGVKMGVRFTIECLAKN